MHRHQVAVLRALMIGLVASTASAQSPVLTLTGTAFERFGSAICGPGDMNGDGVPDIVVGAPDGGPFNFGHVMVFSGAGGAVLHDSTNVVNSGTGKFGGSVATAGDLNQDGFPDVIAGAGSFARIIYGGSFFEVRIPPSSSFPGPNPAFRAVSVDGAGDLNLDGTDDVLVAAPGDYSSVPFPYPCSPLGSSSAGIAYGFNAGTGATLFSLPGVNGDPYPSLIARLGDVNADGRSDFIVGGHGNAAQMQSCFGIPWGNPANPARFEVRSGAGGALIWSFTLSYPVAMFAVSPGDVSQDGRPDVLVRLGAFSALLDGPTGTHLAKAIDSFGGGSAAPLGDPDSDGVPDYIFGDAGFAQVRLFRGLTLAAVRTVYGPPGSEFGAAVASVGDITGDGITDFAVGAPRGDFVQVFSGAVPGSANIAMLGHGCSTPSTDVISLVSTAPVIGQTITLTGTHASAPATLFLSGVSIGAPINILNSNTGVSCPIYLDPFTVAAISAVVPNAGGVWAIALPIPPIPALLNLTATVQAGGFPAGGNLQTTNALLVTLGF